MCNISTMSTQNFWLEGKRKMKNIAPCLIFTHILSQLHILYPCKASSTCVHSTTASRSNGCYPEEGTCVDGKFLPPTRRLDVTQAIVWLIIIFIVSLGCIPIFVNLIEWNHKLDFFFQQDFGATNWEVELSFQKFKNPVVKIFDASYNNSGKSLASCVLWLVKPRHIDHHLIEFLFGFTRRKSSRLMLVVLCFGTSGWSVTADFSSLKHVIFPMLRILLCFLLLIGVQSAIYFVIMLYLLCTSTPIGDLLCKSLASFCTSISFFQWSCLLSQKNI